MGDFSKGAKTGAGFGCGCLTWPIWVLVGIVLLLLGIGVAGSLIGVFGSNLGLLGLIFLAAIVGGLVYASKREGSFGAAVTKGMGTPRQVQAVEDWDDEWEDDEDDQSLQIAAPGDPYSDLERLAELRDKGVITDEEFAQKKRQMLGL